MPKATVAKTCTNCKTFKPRTEFHKHEARKDSLQDHCKECMKAYEATEKGKAAQKRYHAGEKGKAAQKRGYAKRKERFPEKIKANVAVSNAIAAGWLPRSDTFMCSCKKRKAQEYHHWSYAQECWLDVIPVCIQCHKAIHYPMPVS